MTPRSPGLPLALVGLVLAGTALAAQVPPSPPQGSTQTLYVRAKNAHVKKSIDPSANTLLILQPGDTVGYLGREARTPWHRVSAALKDGKSVEGFVYQANLSTTPPSLEITSKQPGKKLSPEAFASSGAAVKAVGPGVLAYGKELPHPEGAQQLDDLEKLALELRTDQVSAYARAGGLPTVVGTDKAVAMAKPTPVKPAPTKTKKGGTR